MKQYIVWWRRHGQGWSQTVYTLQARSEKEAESRLRRMFQHAEFTYMSLCALPIGVHP